MPASLSFSPGNARRMRKRVWPRQFMHLAHLASLLRVQAPPEEALQNGPTPFLPGGASPPLSPKFAQRNPAQSHLHPPNQPWGLPSFSPQWKLLVLQDSSPTSVSLEGPLCLRLLTGGEQSRGGGFQGNLFGVPGRSGEGFGFSRGPPDNAIILQM